MLCRITLTYCTIAEGLVLSLLEASHAGKKPLLAFRYSTYLQEVMLDSIHNDLLHLSEAHEGHQISQGWDLHHTVDMAELLQQTQHRHPLQGLAVLLQSYLFDRTGTCQYGGVFCQPCLTKLCDDYTSKHAGICAGVAAACRVINFAKSTQCRCASKYGLQH